MDNIFRLLQFPFCLANNVDLNKKTYSVPLFVKLFSAQIKAVTCRTIFCNNSAIRVCVNTDFMYKSLIPLEVLFFFTTWNQAQQAFELLLLDIL